jgi:ADP-ribosylglycohydrolase
MTGDKITDMSANAADFDRLLGAGLVPLRADSFLFRSPDPLPAATTFSRIEGMMLGLAIGDSLGNTSEGMSVGERKQMYGEVRDFLPNRRTGEARGYPSDDTQLAFWTLEQLIVDRAFVPEHVLDAFAKREIIGIGNSVRQALGRRRSGMDWRDCGVPSAGNGALMRIAPMLIPYYSRPGPGLWADTALSAMLTHNDAAAVATCVAFIDLLWRLLALDKPPSPEWWLETFCSALRKIETPNRYESRSPAFKDFRGTLSEFMARELPKTWISGQSVSQACDHWYSGAFLLETVPSALYILMRHGSDPEEAMIRAVNDTWDNDTAAAIVGAAVGALHGAAALPERWRQGLSGRTTRFDDGHVQELLCEAERAFNYAHLQTTI